MEIKKRFMKKYIFMLTVSVLIGTGLMAQPGYQTVTILLQNYENYSNLSKGGTFSENNKNNYVDLFSSQNVEVSSLGIEVNAPKQVSLYKFVDMVKNNFDEESDINVVLSKIKVKNPSKVSDNRYNYTVTATQSLTAFKKDGSDFTSLERVTFEVDYIVSANTAKIVSMEIIEAKKGLYMDAHVIGALTSIKGSLVSSASGTLESKSKFGLGYGINLDYMITENFGITSGLTLMSYSTSYTLSTFNQGAYRTVDIDGDEYDLLATGSNLANDVKLNYMEIPIGVVMKFGGFFTRIGAKYGIAGSSSSSFTDGTLTTSGYYPKYSVTLYDIPEYGFDTYDLSGEEGTVDHKSVLNGFLQLGFNAAISQKVGITFMAFYETSFSAVHESSNANIAAGNGEYTSVLNLVDSPKSTAYGLEIGLRFKLF
ncbi:MAG: hypothetical protein C0595_01980 [Marinilabiliales bacterium]|nr:MAG: hypothetical protein C0595_01980 [Marinilabiliales bacterium]